jgi:hypothetical protein
MAADWIKMRTDLYRDPKVCVIADALLAPGGDLARYVNQNLQRDMTVTRNVTRNATVGALVTVWGVMRLRGKRNGNDLACAHASLEVIDDIADLPGLGNAMAMVGWVVETESGITFPRFFDDYNADPTEKKHSSAAERQRRYRERQKESQDGVTSDNGDVTRNVTRDVTLRLREEKSREEKKCATLSRFAEFWEAYPVKKGKADAERKWKSAKFDTIADTIIADVKRRLAEDRQWRDGYIPHGSTYVNGRGWEDAIEPPKSGPASRDDDLPDFMRGAL